MPATRPAKSKRPSKPTDTKIADDRLFVVRRGEVYTSAQVITSFGIANATLQKWMRQGLRSTMCGTRTRYFLGDQIISFLFDTPAGNAAD